MWCRTCQHNLPASYFYDHRRKQGWRVSYPDCIACHSSRRRAKRNDPQRLELEKEKRRAAHAANPHKLRAYAKRHREENLERHKAKDRKYAALKSAEKAEATRKWRAANPQREKEIKLRYRAANLPIILANNKLRKARELRAVPSWFDRTAADAAYLGAKRLEAIIGVRMHVDHIVPLHSAIVCGLHWHGNLQVMAYDENLRKQNRHWPDMPEADKTLKRAMARLR